MACKKFPDPTDFAAFALPMADGDQFLISDADGTPANQAKRIDRNAIGKGLGAFWERQAMAASANITADYPRIYVVADTSGGAVVATMNQSMTGKDGWVFRLIRNGPNAASLAYSGTVEEPSIDTDGEVREWVYRESTDTFEHIPFGTGSGGGGGSAGTLAATLVKTVAGGETEIEFNGADLVGHENIRLLFQLEPSTETAPDIRIETRRADTAAWETGTSWRATGQKWNGATESNVRLTASVLPVTGSTSDNIDAPEGVGGRFELYNHNNGGRDKFGLLVTNWVDTDDLTENNLVLGLRMTSALAKDGIRIKIYNGTFSAGKVTLLGEAGGGGIGADANRLADDTEELIPGKWWEDPGSPGNWYPMYRKGIQLGALPNATTKSVAHGISNPHLESIQLYGEADNGTAVLPLPFPHPNAGVSIDLRYLDATNVRLNTGNNWSTYTGYMWAEYAKTTDQAVATPTGLVGNAVLSVLDEAFDTGKRIGGAIVWGMYLDFGAGPNATVKTVAHGITALSRWLGAELLAYRSSDDVGYTLTLLNTGSSEETANVDATNMKWDSASTDRSSYTAYAYLEWLA